MLAEHFHKYDIIRLLHDCRLTEAFPVLEVVSKATLCNTLAVPPHEAGLTHVTVVARAAHARVARVMTWLTHTLEGETPDM